MLAIYKRELKSYFTGMLGYLYIAFMLVLGGLYCALYNLLNAYANFEYVFYSIDFLYLVAVPILTMRLVAEERHKKTDQLLYSLPLKVQDIVLGKFLALCTLLAIPLCVMCLYPILLSGFGSINFATAYGTILAFGLMGAALSAIGMFLSSITENQIVAALLSFVAVLCCYLIGNITSAMTTSAVAALVVFSVVSVLVGVIFWLVTRSRSTGLTAFVVCQAAFVIWYAIDSAALEKALTAALDSIALFARLQNFVFGLFDLTAIVYYVSIAAMFVFFTMQAIEKRRWS